MSALGAVQQRGGTASRRTAAAAAARRCAPRRRAAVACRASSSSSPSSPRGGGGGGKAKQTRMTVGEANLRPTSPQGWEAMRAALRAAEVAMVAPQELARLRARGAALVDVRPRADHATSRLPGAASAPIYRLIEGWSAEKVLRRLGYALFGVFRGTEVNVDFLEELERAVAEAAAAAAAAAEAAAAEAAAAEAAAGAGAGAGAAAAAGGAEGQPGGAAAAAATSAPPAAPSGPRVVLYCSQGGSIDPVGAAATAAAAGPVPGGAGGGAGGRRGWQSRSLIAAYAIVAARPEYSGGRVAVLRGGFSEWVRGGRQVEGEEVRQEEEGRAGGGP